MKETSRRTVNHYQDHAQAYRDGTLDHDVSQNRDALLAAIGLPGPVDILDLGCGPGRDLVAFQAMGHRPVGLDGCAAFVEMARQQTGLPVLHQDFLDLNLPAAAFDGV
ncbi:MAG TPA: class I SAM-dependent methyltransferase, partial [Alcaligenes faecalis]